MKKLLFITGIIALTTSAFALANGQAMPADQNNPTVNANANTNANANVGTDTDANTDSTVNADPNATTQTDNSVPIGQEPEQDNDQSKLD